MSGFEKQPGSGWRVEQPWQTPWPLADKVAVVVGGSGGIGSAIAQQLERSGCLVAVVGRSADKVEATVAKLERATAYSDYDVRRAEDVDRLFDRVVEEFQQVDLVINCAGIGRASSARLLPDTTVNLAENEWDEVIQTNLRGGFLVARRAARDMIPRRQGQILNISSARGAVRGQPFAAAYCAAKMACVAMFQALAEELRPFGIRAWSLLPDAVDTELIAKTKLANRGSLVAERFAEFVVNALALPADAGWSEPLVAPFSGSFESAKLETH